MKQLDLVILFDDVLSEAKDAKELSKKIEMVIDALGEAIGDVCYDTKIDESDLDFEIRL